MPESIIRKILNRIKWDSQDLEDHEVVFLHRGAPNDLKMYPGTQIKEIERSYIIFIDENEEDGEVIIPFHRIRKIYNRKTNQSVWEK